MRNPELPSQEGIDSELIKDINQLDKIGFGEGAAICQVCGTTLREGDSVTVYAFRPVSEPVFEVGSIFCKLHESEIPNLWTRGVRELVVRGRVGTVSDAAVQASWPVLLAPEVVLVSPANAVEAYTPGEWRELQASSAEENGATAVDEDAAGDVTEAVAEVNELLEPADSIRPAAEQWARGGDEGGDSA